jgi:hypothetical protein
LPADNRVLQPGPNADPPLASINPGEPKLEFQAHAFPVESNKAGIPQKEPGICALRSPCLCGECVFPISPVSGPMRKSSEMSQTTPAGHTGGLRRNIHEIIQEDRFDPSLS